MAEYVSRSPEADASPATSGVDPDVSWAHAALLALFAADEQHAQADAAEAERRLATPDKLSREERVAFETLSAASHGRLAQLGSEQVANAKAARRDIEDALAIDAGNRDAVEVFARGALELAALGSIKRFMAEKALGVSIAEDVKRAKSLIAALPPDAVLQELERLLLAFAP